MKLDFPNRLVMIRAGDLADSIHAIRELCLYLTGHDQRLDELHGLWDRLSAVIEEPVTRSSGKEADNAQRLLDCTQRSGLYLNEID